MSIELRGVTKRYPNGAIGALDVDLVVPTGAFVALFGPSGSGKTSQLHMMGLLQRPDSGEVWIDGERVDEFSESRGAKLRSTKLGFVFQSASLLNLASARENVDVSLRLNGQRGICVLEPGHLVQGHLAHAPAARQDRKGTCPRTEVSVGG